MRRRMPEQSPPNPAVDEFVQRELDSVPHLEALLLLWTNRKPWTVEEMGAALYVNDGVSRDILQNLTRRNFAARGDHDTYTYLSASPERDNLVAALETEYRRNLIRITRMIHAKASPGVREFADAFRFKKDRD
jgi:hypothetical protein